MPRIVTTRKLRKQPANRSGPAAQPTFRESDMAASPDRTFRCAALSVVKHAYVPNGVAAHPRFDLVVVADDADQPAW